MQVHIGLELLEQGLLILFLLDLFLRISLFAVFPVLDFFELLDDVLIGLIQVASRNVNINIFRFRLVLLLVLVVDRWLDFVLILFLVRFFFISVNRLIFVICNILF